MHFIKLITILFLFILSDLHAQKNVITILDSGRKTSLRGLSPVDDKIIWASGSNGTVTRSTDGKTLEWLTVKGFEQRDFRDIEAFDVNTALIMAVNEPAIILKTKDGGKNWYKVFEDDRKGMFLDAMDFKDNKNGIVVGDPINKRAFIAYTQDQGEHWTVNANIIKDTLQTGEAFFAASGTNIKLITMEKKSLYFICVTGGTRSRYIADNIYTLPIVQGKESQGANSVAMNDDNTSIAIVGGDYLKDSASSNNCVIFQFDKTWKVTAPRTSPHGYRSCVAFISNGKLISCGTSGVDISNDGGITWQLISSQSFNVCQKAKNGSAVFFAGGNGKIAKWD